MHNLIVTSSDGHAVIPAHLWAEYLDKKYHKYLERLKLDVDLFCGSMWKLSNLRTPPESFEIFDKEGVYRAGHWNGLWDAKIRLKEMDREGIAAEFVFPGDQHCLDLFWNTTNDTYPAAAADAGARAFDRWSYDTFGAWRDRLLLIGASQSGLDIDAMLDQSEWLAGHGFVGVWTPNYCSMPGQIPIFDGYWDRLWAAYSERNLVMITHAGWGITQGFMHGEVLAALAEVKAEKGDDDLLKRKLLSGVFGKHGVFADLRARQGMWQFMLGGVFDRHPNLKMMVTEIRADWLPETLKMLDKVWEANRDKLPAKRRPSEYWATNCMAGLSFMNKTEVARRHDIGVKTMAFGRDYPHTEATWPNTMGYFSDVLRGVPEQEVSDILGENMVRFLELDRAHLASVAQKIGAPTFKQIAQGAPLEPALLAHLNVRCGYSEAAEGGARIPEMEAMVGRDLPRITAAAAAF